MSDCNLKMEDFELRILGQNIVLDAKQQLSLHVLNAWKEDIRHTLNILKVKDSNCLKYQK